MENDTDVTLDSNNLPVSKSGAERAARDAKALVDAGFAIKPPVYTMGTVVLEEGARRFRESRQEFDALPMATEILDEYIVTIGEEKREDKIVPITNLDALPDGRLHNAENGTYKMSERALGGLCGFATPGGAGYLAACSPALRAENLNYWLPRALRVDARATEDDSNPVMTPKECTLRTRMRDGEREIFGIVGPRYGNHDGDKIAAQIIKAIPGNARGSVRYDGAQTRFDILFHSDIQPETCVAGETFKAGVRITCSDDGTGAIKISAAVERNLCRNLIIIDKAKQDVAKRSHRGKSENIANDVEAGIALAMTKVKHFAETWDQATMENVMDKYALTHDEETVKKMFRAIAFSKLVYIPNVSYTDMGERLFRAWEKEPGYQRTSFVNAITRAAHEETWHAIDVGDTVALQGSNLLFRKDWKVSFPDDNQVEQLVTVAV